MSAASKSIDRRKFLSTSALAGAALVTAPTAARAVGDPAASGYSYEVQRSEDDWRARLTKEEFKILRGGDTELPHTSELVPVADDGTYHCKGCDLPVFSSNWKVPLTKGWVFFAHAEEASVLTSIDGPQRAYGMNPNGFANLIEVHCRRCGSHLGHHLIVDGEMLYCINGTALTFTAASA